MKIIIHGERPEPAEDMIAQCDACKCVFTFGQHESEKLSNNGGGFVYQIGCPECGGDCDYDTGYPGDSALDERVKQRQEWLRALIPEDAGESVPFPDPQPMFTAPTDGRSILVWDGDCWVEAHFLHGSWWGDHHSSVRGTSLAGRELTHWLPQPPDPSLPKA